MRRHRRSLLLASVLAAAPLLVIASPMPASAQISADISFDSFHGQLAGYGDWLYSDRWGEVWRPEAQDRDPDWRPYWAGHWVFTDEYGWTWISDEGSWGDIAYHYGRWVFDPDDGWLWLPGYVWSPAWVVWRSAGPNVGWMPMPPDDNFLSPGGISVNVSFGNWDDVGGYYGYARWYGPRFDQARFGALWTFVPGGRIADPGFRRFALARPETVNIVQNSRNVTNYTVVNNTIINRSVNINMVQGAGGRPPQAVRADTVLRSNRWVAPVNQGQQIQARMRQQNPRGNGQVNSAPPPTQAQIGSLSNRPIPVRTQSNAPGQNNNAPVSGGGEGNRHLFNRANAGAFAARANNQPANNQPANSQPAAQPAPQAQPNAGPQPNSPPQAGPNDNGRGRRDFNRPQNNPQTPQLENRQPQALPNNPAPNAPAPERNRGFERQPPNPPPPQDRQQNFQRNFDRAPQEQRPQAMPAAPQREQAPPRQEQRAPAIEQRPQAAPERAQREQAPPREQARPNPPPDRGQERGQDRGDRRNQDNRGNDNK